MIDYSLNWMALSNSYNYSYGTRKASIFGKSPPFLLAENRMYTVTDYLEPSFLETFGRIVSDNITDLYLTEEENILRTRDWVQRETGQAIQYINSPATFGIILSINAVRFEGTFDIPFVMVDSQNRIPFYIDYKRDRVQDNAQVQMLCNKQVSAHYFLQYKEYEMIKLNYAYSYFSLILAKPIKSNYDTISHFLKKNYSVKDLKSLQWTKSTMNVCLPKLKIEFENDLAHVLKNSAGMAGAFDPLLADFSGISSFPNGKVCKNVHHCFGILCLQQLYMSSVLHKATVVIDGVGISNAEVDLPSVSGSIPAIRFDYPFHLFIWDEKNNIILFAGHDEEHSVTNRKIDKHKNLDYWLWFESFLIKISEKAFWSNFVYEFNAKIFWN
ncbi:leukocyte elastase inhibitor [Reticulomyxa filosa]|uniref:Leukocyte elastase inhibitor n=1 Tax=Reticulomyxa filosa TaxID=46433 RepID=X6M0C7_RETFI|nr:leukocyte elastase inhibitor [Reticulomyxa filosa]|eukprot:ETO07339.1 leukocyte elastase inhibitor [Reticulomyxa filosa]